MKYKNQKHILPISVIGLMIIIFFSCAKTDIQFGQQFIDNNYGQIIQTDTITPVVSTVYIDSFATNNLNTALVGVTNDTAIGTTTYSSYFQLGVPTYNSTSTAYDNAIYDSLTLFVKLKTGGVWSGDTTKPLTLNVYRLTQNIIAPNYGSSLYNTDAFTYDPTPLGSYTIPKYYPNLMDSTNDTLSIRLSDALGMDLLNKLQNDSLPIQSSNAFIYFFNGLKIAAASNSNLAIALSDSVQMRLYFKTPASPQDTEKYIIFPIYQNNLQFNSVSVQRKGALSDANINSINYQIPSSQTNNSAYLQPMANTVIKLNFPTVYSLLLRQSYIKIVKATLYVRPVNGSYNPQTVWQLPPTLYLYQTDLHNGFGSSLSSGSSGAAQGGNLQYDVVSGNSELGTYYSYDLTSYLQGMAANPGALATGVGLLLSPPTSSIYTTYNRLIIGDGSNANAKMDLQIQYISVQ